MNAGADPLVKWPQRYGEFELMQGPTTEFSPAAQLPEPEAGTYSTGHPDPFAAILEDTRRQRSGDP